MGQSIFYNQQKAALKRTYSEVTDRAEMGSANKKGANIYRTDEVCSFKLVGWILHRLCEREFSRMKFQSK